MNTSILNLRVVSVAAVIACFAGSAEAGTVYARVLSVQPEVTQVHVPERVCDQGRQDDAYRRHNHHRCYTVDRVENRVTGYRVTYEHHGRIETTYSRYNPGRTIAVEEHGHHYGNRHVDAIRY